MFKSNDSIKFMMAKIFFNLAEFSYKIIDNPTISLYQGADTTVINFIKHGNGKIIVNSNEYEIKDNSYFVINSFSSYQIIPNGKIELYSIYLLIDKTTGYKKFFYLLEKPLIGIDKTNISMLFDMLKNELTNKQFGYNEIVVSLFKTIIVTILRNENITSERLSHWDLDNSQFQIDTILNNEFQTITLEELANRLYMSPRELQRYLVTNYKKTFINLRNDARMSFASNKLLYSNLSISEISNLVGYSSIEHFSYAFKNYYGLPPLKYRKSHKK